MTSREAAEGLREMADFLDSNPDTFLNYAGAWCAQVRSAEEIKDTAGRFGTFKKEWDDYELALVKEFSGGVCLRASISRELLGCKKVVTWDCPEGIESLLAGGD